jgi:hypothetical protein
MKNVSESDLLKACIYFVKSIESLPDDTEKCRHIKLCFNNRAGELFLEAVNKAKGE